MTSLSNTLEALIEKSRIGHSIEESEIKLKPTNEMDVQRVCLNSINIFYPVLVELIMSYAGSPCNWSYVDCKNKSSKFYIIMDENIINFYSRKCGFGPKFDEQGNISFNEILPVSRLYCDTPYIYAVRCEIITAIQYYTKKSDNIMISYLRGAHTEMFEEIERKVISKIININQNTVYIYDLDTNYRTDLLISEHKSKKEYSIKHINGIYLCTVTNTFFTHDTHPGPRYFECFTPSIFIDDNNMINVAVRSNYVQRTDICKLSSNNTEFWCVTVPYFDGVKIIYCDDYEIMCVQYSYDCTYITRLNKSTKEVCCENINSTVCGVSVCNNMLYISNENRICIYKSR